MGEQIITTELNGAPCEIKDFNNKLLATGTLRVAEERAAEIYDTGSHMPLLEINTWVKLCVHGSSDGMIVVTGQVYVSNRDFVRLVQLQNVAFKEQRSYFRQSIDHSAVIFYPKKEPVRVRDVSLCGMLIESGQNFAVGDEIQLYMTLYQNLPETMTLVVRRVIIREDNRKAYGCELLNLSRLAEQRLSAFIMRQQQEQIRRSRGMTQSEKN